MDRENDKPSEEAAKNVFAHFGSAYYYAEVLHRGLCNLYVARMLPTTGATRLRTEELLSYAFKTTLGSLVAELRPLVTLPTEVEGAVERRNYIAHHFWFEQVHRMYSALGCESLVAELEADQALFREVDRQIDALHENELRRLGQLEHFKAFLPDWLSNPQQVDPLPEARKLRKKETLLEVYEVETETGGRTLVFELEDKTLWQLCEIGLGWTALERAEGWRPCEKFAEFLPATISPRPTATSPWNFEIRLGSDGILAVWHNPEEPSFRWTIRRQK